MKFLTQYATGIIVASAVALLCDMLMPEGNIKKYVKIVSGLLVTLVIASPIAKLPFYAETFQIPELDSFGVEAQELQSLGSDAIRAQFEADLANKIAQALEEQLHTQCEVAVEAGVDAEGAVSELRAVHIRCADSLSKNEIARFVAELVGIEAERIDITLL